MALLRSAQLWPRCLLCDKGASACARKGCWKVLKNLSGGEQGPGFKSCRVGWLSCLPLRAVSTVGEGPAQPAHSRCSGSLWILWTRESQFPHLCDGDDAVALGKEGQAVYTLYCLLSLPLGGQSGLCGAPPVSRAVTLSGGWGRGREMMDRTVL